MKKSEYYEIVSKYQMEDLINNEVNREIIGHYVVTNKCVDELDEIVKNSWPEGNVSATRMYMAGEYLYKLFPPKNWID